MTRLNVEKCWAGHFPTQEMLARLSEMLRNVGPTWGNVGKYWAPTFLSPENVGTNIPGPGNVGRPLGNVEKCWDGLGECWGMLGAY